MIREMALVWAIAALQTPAGTQPTTPPPAPAQGAMVTVEGCVTRVEPPATGGATVPDAPPTSTTQYVLVDPSARDATGTSGASPERGGTTSPGATASGTPVPGRRMYVLKTQAGATDLSQHVGHKVRVTGATTAPMTSAPLAGRSPEATPTPGSTAQPGATGTPFDTANLPSLAITQLTMVARTCS